MLGSFFGGAGAMSIPPQSGTLVFWVLWRSRYTSEPVRLAAFPRWRGEASAAATDL